jgi:hypothetical protein
MLQVLANGDEAATKTGMNVTSNGSADVVHEEERQIAAFD